MFLDWFPLGTITPLFSVCHSKLSLRPVTAALELPRCFGFPLCEGGDSASSFASVAYKLPIYLL